MPHYDFKKDFPIAQQTEQEVAALLEKKYGCKILHFCNNADYDILVENKDGEKLTVEIKEDFLAAKTHNVGLEFGNRGKMSGISVSKADWYIYKIHKSESEIVFLLISTKKLKSMIENHVWFRQVEGGDPGSRSLNYLFKYEVFCKNGILL